MPPIMTKKNQSFYQQNIIISLYIASILAVSSLLNIFRSVPLEFILFLTILPHVIEILMTNLDKRYKKVGLALGVFVNALIFSFVARFLNYELTLVGILLLMLSYQSLFHLGFAGWVLTIMVSCVGIMVHVMSGPYLVIPQAPFQLLIISITCGLFFMFHSAGNAYNNVAEIKRGRRKVDALVAKQNKWVKLISRYLSPKIVDEIVSDKISGNEGYQKKPLTIFFSDIVGFTAISEKITTQELAYFLNDYLTAMSNIANKYDATIDKFIGDGIMIFFGDPHTKGPEGDVDSALRMAIEMQKKMSDLNARWSRMNFKYKFNVRMGIHHGVATVGNFGANVQMNYTAIGSNVNLAARLEQAAPESGIMVSNDVRELASNQFRFIESKSVTLKGIDEPVSVSLLDYHYEYIEEDASTPSGIPLNTIQGHLDEIRRLRTLKNK